MGSNVGGKNHEKARCLWFVASLKSDKENEANLLSDKRILRVSAV